MTHVPVDPIISPVLIGRESELGILYQLIGQTRNGAGHAIAISGEAGIGKSRLVQQSIIEARNHGFLVLTGCCFPPDINCPYAPILDLLRNYFAENASDHVAAKAFLVQEHFPLLPEIIPIASNANGASGLDPEQEKRRIFAVLIQWLRQQAEKTPVFCLIEDIHWSDSCSLEFLHQLIRRCALQRMMFVVTYRNDDSSAQLRPWLAQLDRERLVRELHLTHLTLAEVKEMVRVLMGAPHVQRPESSQIIYQATDGNPFFIEELLKSLRESGELTQLNDAQPYTSVITARHIPRTVGIAVQERFERLSEAARQTAALAAVIGRRFDFSLLQAVSQWTEVDLIQALKALVSAHLIVEESSDRYGFRHALTQQAVYDTLLGREQKTLHQKVAETIENHYANKLGLYTEELARHFHIVGDWKKSLDYSTIAGEQALQLYDPYTAIKHFNWALDAAQHLDGLPRFTLYQKRSQAYEMLGDFDRAHSDLQTVLDLARAAEDHQVEWQCLIALGFLWSSRSYAQTGQCYQQALALAQTLADPSILAQTLNRLGNWHLNIEEPRDAQRYHQQALTVFERLDNSEGIADTLDLLGMANCLGGNLVQSAVYLTRAADFFRTLDNRTGLSSCWATLTLCGMTYQTNTMISPELTLAVAVDYAERALRLAQENGLQSSVTYALSMLGFCLGSQGEYGRGLIVIEQAAALATEIGHRQWTIIAHAAWGAIYWDLLDTPRALEHLEYALAIAQEVGSLHWLRTTSGFLASACLSHGNIAQATTILAAVMNPEMPMQTVGQRLCWSAYAELVVAQGNSQTALTIAEKLIDSAENASSNEAAVAPRVGLLQGQILTRLQRFNEAESVLLAVQRIVVLHGAQPLLWRVQIALGKLYLAQGRTSAAADAFLNAETTIADLAAKLPDEESHDAFVGRAVAAIPQLSSQQRAKQTFGGLTNREWEVAGLVAQGKSNREIADSLVISERTIETHISNIFNKLSFSSRTQIAIWAAQKGLSLNNERP